MQNIHFELAKLSQKTNILTWLDEPHIREFWDNSQEHRDDIVVFMNGRKKPSPYYDGMFTYWVGSIDSDPYCLVMTSIIEDTPDLKESWRQQLSKNGNSYSIDFCIGNVNYFQKGLAAPTLKAFTKFFHDQIDNKADTFIIDPNENNPRAKYVYEKAGFKTISKFERRAESFYLMVKKLPT